MTAPPDAPEISVTKTLRLELDSNQLEYVLKEWAKTRGFSHRVSVQFECCNRATLTETLPATTEPPKGSLACAQCGHVIESYRADGSWRCSPGCINND